ncbi:PHD-finger, partial [Opisthorchis viverrini]
MNRTDSDLLLSDLENSMDTLPGTPLSRCVDADLDQNSGQGDSQPTTTQPLTSSRRDARIKSETMLSRVASFASITEPVSMEEIFEYDWADSDSESPNDKNKESYMVQELLADYLKIKSFKRKYPDLTRRTMDAYERSWLQQEGLVPVGRADLGLTALRTDEVMKLLQSDYPEVHTLLSDLFRRRRFQKAAEIQKRQYEAARIERGEARAEAARRRALDSAADYNHRLVTDRFTSRRCYWDLQTMQIHFPQPGYKLLEHDKHPNGAYPVAVIPGQFAEHYEVYTPEQLMRLPLSRCIYSQPSRRHKAPPPLPTNLRFGSLQPRVVPPQTTDVGSHGGVQDSSFVDSNDVEDQQKQSMVNESSNLSVTALNKEVKKDSTAERLAVSDSTPVTPSPTNSNRLNSQSNTLSKQSDGVQSAQCVVCKQETKTYIRCSECGHTGHPKCLDISESMLVAVKSYQWSCMECKRCVECSDSGHEDQMMFCDRCDRGYHAFCVGLEDIPDGRWECPLCTPESKSETPTRKRSNNSRKGRRGSTASRTKAESASKRPRKYRRRSDTPSATDDEAEAKPKPKRKARKKKEELSDVSTAEDTPPNQTALPNSSEAAQSQASEKNTESTPKRKRGRPRLTDVDPRVGGRKPRPRPPKKLKLDPSSCEHESGSSPQLPSSSGLDQVEDSVPPPVNASVTPEHMVDSLSSADSQTKLPEDSQVSSDNIKEAPSPSRENLTCPESGGEGNPVENCLNQLLGAFTIVLYLLYIGFCEKSARLIRQTRYIRHTVSKEPCEIPVFFKGRYFPDCIPHSELDDYSKTIIDPKHSACMSDGELKACEKDAAGQLVVQGMQEFDVGACDGWGTNIHRRSAADPASRFTYGADSELGQQCTFGAESESNQCVQNYFYGVNSASDYGKLTNLAYEIDNCRFACAIRRNCRAIEFIKGISCALILDSVGLADEHYLGVTVESKPDACDGTVEGTY